MAMVIAITAALLACATHVHPDTMARILHAENNGGNPLAVHVNHYDGRQPQPDTLEDAAAITRHFIQLGYTVDLGLAQINSRNLIELGTTVEEMLSADQCRNVAAGGAILAANYVKAAEKMGEGQAALGAAISAYNTGDWAKGYANGYVGRVMGSEVHLAAAATPAVPPPPDPYSAPTAVYVNERYALHVKVN